MLRWTSSLTPPQPAQPPYAGQTPPTKNTDGSDLTDLMGYRIHIGAASGTHSRVIPVNDNTIDSYVVENLAAGTWYFAVSAADTSGNESTLSNEESNVVSIP